MISVGFQASLRFVEFATDYYERQIAVADVAAVYRREPLTEEFVTRHNRRSISNLSHDVDEIERDARGAGLNAQEERIEKATIDVRHCDPDVDHPVPTGDESSRLDINAGEQPLGGGRRRGGRLRASNSAELTYDGEVAARSCTRRREQAGEPRA